jgi:integrase
MRLNMDKKNEFIDLLARYAKHKSLSDATIRTYRGVVRQFCRDTGIVKMRDVKLEALLEWRLNVLSRSSDITWNNYLRHMRALWSFAHDMGLIKNQEHYFKKLNWGKKRIRRAKTLTDGQLQNIRDYLSLPDCGFEPCWFWLMVVRLLYGTGIRRRQLVELKWKDIDLNNGMLFLSSEGDKTDTERSMPIPEGLVEQLRQYRQTAFQIAPASCKPHAQAFNVTQFNPKYAGDAMNETQVSGFFKRLSKRLGFKASSHRFRHTMATEIAKTGKIKPLQLILGHSDVRTTMNFYIHPDYDELKSVLCGLNEL